MANYRRIQAIYGTPGSSYQPQKWIGGTIISDGVAPMAGAIVWPSECIRLDPSVMVPLDADGVAQFAKQGFTVAVGQWQGASTGMDSVS